MADRTGPADPDLSTVSRLIGETDAARIAAGYLSLSEMLARFGSANRILDPFSVLISEHVHIGTDNTFYPGITLRAAADTGLSVGNDNVFWSNSLIEASAGPVIIGNGNQFGDGGFTAKANQPGARITIGHKGRYMGNPSVFGNTDLQDGSQILGAITVISCRLEAGGSHQEPDPDLRAGLLKGFGIAKNLTVQSGHVIPGEGIFHPENAVLQSTFHPR